jgi:hypothetical protein
MSDSTISRGRERHLVRPGPVRFATPRLVKASSGLACALASRPGAASWRPGAGDLAESII